jgi:hypothetical protein
MDEIFMDVHKNSNEIIKNLILMLTLQQIFQTCKIFSNFLARVESNEKIASFHNNNYFLNSYFKFFFRFGLFDVRRKKAKRMLGILARSVFSVSSFFLSISV